MTPTTDDTHPAPALEPSLATPRIALSPGGERSVSSEDLFAGACEVLVRHEGAVYRLRRTALGKLILTK